MRKSFTLLILLMLAFVTGTRAEVSVVWLHGANFDKENSTDAYYQFTDADGFTLTMNNRAVSKTPCNWTDSNGNTYTDGINFKNNDPGIINVPNGYQVMKVEIGGASQSNDGNLCYLYSVDVDGVNFFTDTIGQNIKDNNIIQNAGTYPMVADVNAPLFATLDFSDSPAKESIKVIFSGNNQENVWFKVYYYPEVLKTVTLHGANFDKENSTNSYYQFTDVDGFTLTMNNRDINKTPSSWTDPNGILYTDGINFKKNDPGTINVPEGYEVKRIDIGGQSQSDTGNLCYLYTVDVDGTNIFTDGIGQNITANSTIHSTATYPMLADGNAPRFAAIDLSAKQGITVAFSGNNQVNVWFKVYYSTSSSTPVGNQEAAITAISVNGSEADKAEGTDYEVILPKKYADATTTISVTKKNGTVTATAADSNTATAVNVTDNGDGTFSLPTPAEGSATKVTFSLTANDGCTALQSEYTLMLTHLDKVMLANVTVDGAELSAEMVANLNNGSATLNGNVYTTIPEVTAKTIDGVEAQVTKTNNVTTATYTLNADGSTFTLNVNGLYLYNRTENDQDYTIVYTKNGKEAYVAKDTYTDGWTNELYTLRTTSLDGWEGQQFKFNAADNVLEVPGGVVVKTFTLSQYGANYGAGEGLTSITSDGATFHVPTQHGYERGGKKNVTVVVENHKAGEPIAFTITGGNQPYAKIDLVIEKTNIGTAPAAKKTATDVIRNHAMVSVTFDREMAAADVDFNGQTAIAEEGLTLNFGIADLEFNKEYTFTIPAGQVEDLFGNKNAEEINVNFTTEARPAVEKKAFDYVVGSAEEFTNVITALGSSTDNTLERVTIFLKDGDYDFGEDNEQRIYRGNVSLVGQSRDGVVIHGTRTGISNPILNIRDREGFYLQDITVRNDLDFRQSERKGVAAAIYGGNRSIFKNVQMQSQQDTHVTGENSYYDKCRIQGSVDFLCGGGNHIFDHCQIVLENKGAVISAPATIATAKWGYVFKYCTIDRAEAGIGATIADKGEYSLSRPWQNEPRTYYLYTQMNVQPNDNGYTKMSDLPTHFYEYGSVDKDGNAIDLSVRGNSPSSTNTYSPVITEAEAKRFTTMNVLYGTNKWMPTDFTSLTKAPDVSVNGKTLSWDNDDQVRAWVIFKDDKYVADVTETSYTVEENGSYTVRSVNAMGGLSADAASVIVNDATAVISVAADNTDLQQPAYNIAGQRTDASAKGVVIVDGKKIMK